MHSNVQLEMAGRALLSTRNPSKGWSSGLQESIPLGMTACGPCERLEHIMGLSSLLLPDIPWKVVLQRCTSQAVLRVYLSIAVFTWMLEGILYWG